MGTARSAGLKVDARVWKETVASLATHVRRRASGQGVQAGADGAPQEDADSKVSSKAVFILNNYSLLHQPRSCERRRAAGGQQLRHFTLSLDAACHCL